MEDRYFGERKEYEKRFGGMRIVCLQKVGIIVKGVYGGEGWEMRIGKKNWDWLVKDFEL